MKNMKVSKKLIISFLIVAALAIVVGAVGIIGITNMEAKDTELYEMNLLAIGAMADFRETYQMERTQLRAMIMAIGDPASVYTYANAFSGFEKTITDAMAVYEKTITDKTKETDYYSAKDTYLGSYSKARQAMIDAAKAGDYELARQLLTDAGPTVEPIVNGLKNSADLNDMLAKEMVEANSSLAFTLTITQSVVLVITVAIALFFAIYISGMISKPLTVLTAFMKQAGETGDITLRPVDVENITRYSQYRDETGQCIGSTASFIKHISSIAESLGTIANGDLTAAVEILSDKDVMGIAMQKVEDNLNGMFADINASTIQVATGAKQIADGSQALAQGATEQAASVQQLSSSISDIAQQTKANAEMAAKTATLADTIKSNAEKGSRQMGEMMSAVTEINQASQNINKVITVIDSIAFQTNILALNAAVEAARAGQHGKGFAVVAEEVGNLAAKSAEAAKETSSMIANSIEKAELGARIAEETASSLTDIVSGINESSTLVGQIARSSEEQSAGISQINKGIEQVAQVVQHNSATAQESAAASQEMSAQAATLEDLITQFKLKDSDTRMGIPSSSGSHKRIASNDRSSRTSESAQGFGKY